MLQSGIVMIFIEITGFATAVFAVSAASFRMASFFSAGRVLGRRAFIEPALRAVGLLLRVPAGKDAAQVFGVAKVLSQDERRIGVVHHVLAEILIVRQRVVD